VSKITSYYLAYVLIHILFIGNLLLRDYFQGAENAFAHTLSVVIMWLMLLFLLLRWDYILPIYKLNTKYANENGRIVFVSSKIAFFIYKLTVWGVSLVAPVVLIMLGLRVNSLLVFYCALIFYLFVYLNRRVLFDSFATYQKSQNMIPPP
jgi:hypothetical protein